MDQDREGLVHLTEPNERECREAVEHGADERRERLLAGVLDQEIRGQARSHQQRGCNVPGDSEQLLDRKP